MARRNLINVNCASITEVFRHVKDFLLARNGIADYSAGGANPGLGWTLHDSSFAVDQDNPATGDWIVLSSTGENGKQALYYYIKFTTLVNSIMQTRSGLHWNAATNAWVVGYPAADQSCGPTSGTSFSLWIYGTLDHFNIIIGNGSLNYGRSYGLPDGQMHDTTIATTTGAVSAGSNVVVTVDAVPASWAVGKAVIIRDLAGIERATIAGISGTNVTITALVNSYASGARIAADYSTYITAGTNFLDGGRTQIGRSGLTTDAGQTVSGDAHSNLVAAGVPDKLNNIDWLKDYVKIYSATYGYYGYHRDVFEVSSTGLTSGQEVTEESTGNTYRALFVDAHMYLFREV